MQIIDDAAAILFVRSFRKTSISGEKKPNFRLKINEPALHVTIQVGHLNRLVI